MTKRLSFLSIFSLNWVLFFFFEINNNNNCNATKRKRKSEIDRLSLDLDPLGLFLLFSTGVFGGGRRQRPRRFYFYQIEKTRSNQFIKTIHLKKKHNILQILLHFCSCC